MLRLLLLTMILMQDASKNKRVVALYTHDTNNPAYLQQLRLLAADEPGLNERDLIVQKFIYNETTAHRFRAKIINSDFTFILIGKDGGEKYRSTTVVPLKQLYALIDAMPMRVEEMRGKKE